MKRRWVWLFSLVTLALVAFMGRDSARAWWVAERNTANFVRSDVDPRVFYEQGAEESARFVSIALPSALRVVEAAMGTFHGPVRIYVCASIESFTRYGANARAGALTSNHRIFISPKPENTTERMPALMEHELSHLHLMQDLGVIDYARLPVWFAEGLAVVVSGGAGAENVSAAEARTALSKGKTFVPDGGGLWKRGGAHAAGLSQHMFYRQAGLFVTYLRSSTPDRFDALVVSLKRGIAFEGAFRSAYGSSVAGAWDHFLRTSPAP